MMILSMDLDKFNTVCCFYDTERQKYRFETIATKRSHVDHLLDTCDPDLVVMEACGPSGWVSDVCKQRGLKTIVCSTHDEAWAWKNTKRKTDRHGCGYYMALALASRIGEASRFPRGKSLAHYWGLTPGVRDSGDSKGHRGHITKSGCSMARWLLAQVVFHVLRRDPVMRKWYKPIRNRRGSGIARTAVMRRMAVIIRNMLTEKQSYTECRDAMIDRRKKQTQVKASAA
ncbi:MAG: IS110 family transposase [Planctomycetota bacterium]